MTIKHPVLKYYGAKFRLAEWIISHFPEHKHYVEPFGGAANVLLLKERSKLETYNDLNDLLVNFFRVLRDNPDRLIQQVKLTPYSRTEYEFCVQNAQTDDLVEMARRLYYRLWMSIEAGVNSPLSNFRRRKNPRNTFLFDPRPENLFQASERFLKVQIENRDAVKLIQEMDSDETLFYLDPPYVHSTRKTNKVYTNEMTDDAHAAFAEILYQLKGYVLISGYPTELYKKLFEEKGWKRVDRQANVSGGGERTESLWISPKTVNALNPTNLFN